MAVISNSAIAADLAVAGKKAGLKVLTPNVTPHIMQIGGIQNFKVG